MQVYAAHFVPLVLHVAFWIVLAVECCVRYMRLGVPLPYCSAFLLPVAIDVIIAAQLLFRIGNRRRVRREIEEKS
jgi:hypothetical protein